MTHAYKRNGNATLFAAFNVPRRRLPQHRAYRCLHAFPWTKNDPTASSPNFQRLPCLSLRGLDGVLLCSSAISSHLSHPVRLCYTCKARLFIIIHYTEDVLTVFWVILS